MIDARRVDFVALPVSDLGRADAFYGETLGLARNPNTSGERWVEYETGNLTLGLSMFGGSIAFGVDDVAAGRADARGRRRRVPRRDVRLGRLPRRRVH